MVPCISDFKSYCDFEKLKRLIEDDIDYDTFNDAYEEQANRFKKLIKLDFLGNGCSRACFKMGNIEDVLKFISGKNNKDYDRIEAGTLFN